MIIQYSLQALHGRRETENTVSRTVPGYRDLGTPLEACLGVSWGWVMGVWRGVINIESEKE